MSRADGRDQNRDLGREAGRGHDRGREHSRDHNRDHSRDSGRDQVFDQFFDQELLGADRDQSWLDADAGRLIRPYTVSGGRTQPSVVLDLLSMVRATGRALKVDLTPEHDLALDLSRAPVTVAEIGAHLHLPVAVAKILLSDLIDQGAVTARPPDPAADPADRDILQRVLDGLHKRLLQ